MFCKRRVLIAVVHNQRGRSEVLQPLVCLALHNPQPGTQPSSVVPCQSRMRARRCFLTTSTIESQIRTSVSFVLIKSQLFLLDEALDQTSLKLPLFVYIYTNMLLPLFCKTNLNRKVFILKLSRIKCQLTVYNSLKIRLQMYNNAIIN